jgi:hypothetical protein
MDKNMKMNQFIETLKQQSRQGGVPRLNLTGTQPAASSAITPRDAMAAPTTSAITDQVRQLAQQLANQMVAEQQQTQILARNGRTYTKFDTANDIISNQTETVTAGLWSDNLASLETFFTSSTQTTSQRRYYVDTYHKATTETGSAVQFSLAFGHALGSGSDSQGQLNDSPSKAIYSQYRQLLLSPTDTRFTTAGSGSTDYIYVVNFKRNRLKERLDPGNWEIPLRPIASRATNATGSVVTGSNAVLQLIDDSSISSATVGQSGKVYNIVSGSIDRVLRRSKLP